MSAEPDNSRRYAGHLVPANNDTIAEAARLLRAGRLVAVPTETVYGLAADASNDMAVAALFAVKDRPRFNPLIVHVENQDKARQIGHLDPLSEVLAEAFWPGPLTLVLPRTPTCPACELVSAGLATVAVRVPLHPVARAVIAAAGVPLAAPSANLSGAMSPTHARHVAEALSDKIDLILDAGPSSCGLESTVIQVIEGQAVILRPGAIARADIEAVAGPVVDAKPGTVTSPGQLAHHYAPTRALRLEATTVTSDECLLAFGPPIAGHAIAVRNLSPRGDLTEAAANFFAHLHVLDKIVCRAIAVMPIPDSGLGEAINDRLRRAAAPRQSLP